MKYIIINSSTNFEYRVDLIYEYLAAKGDEITVLASDFIHSEKKKRTEAKHSYELINTIPYKKNLSISRLLSHYDFSKKAYKRIKDEESDVLYLMIPQNSNAKIGKWYKKKHPDTKIVMDIVDMWPESLPEKYTDRWPFTIWANIRNKNLKYADVIVTECDYYQEKLKKWLQGKKTVTIPWLKRYRAWSSKFENIDENNTTSDSKAEKKDKISLCYLGAVNNIIDIDKICVKNISIYNKIISIECGEYFVEKDNAFVKHYFSISSNIVPEIHNNSLKYGDIRYISSNKLQIPYGIITSRITKTKRNMEEFHIHTCDGLYILNINKNRNAYTYTIKKYFIRLTKRKPLQKIKK